ncbi:MAG: sugar ABC transporter ATP-binding protein [Burkholderiaceae bacterium]|nr:MAG: sugar ABC transporter ATP-binding protein [Burkholderiaceae bacterium]TAM02550.1 MAG: sugar ABC transporter ATP-binding protein [Pusillimonas sp.]
MSLFELRGIHRSFGGIHALRGASFKIGQPGSIHALLGSNGCGKSTLLRIATGQLRADAGEIYLDGKPVNFAEPRDALRNGIATVTQETTLVPDLTVAENILMGKLPRRRFGPIDWPGAYRAARKLLDALGLELPENVTVRQLRPDQQQMVEIARAFSMQARILVLDEATSALTDDEVQAVFRVIRNASQRGTMATILVSHRMDEIYNLANEVTVLRDGKTVSTRLIADADRNTLITDMIGESVASTPKLPRHSVPDASGAPSRLQINGLFTAGSVENVSLSVAAGEVVGITGLTRSGANELLEAVYGSRTVERGRILVDGRDITRSDIDTAIRAGIGFVPADRKRQGVLLNMSVRHNMLIPSTAHHLRARLPRRRPELALVHRIAESVSMRMDGADSPVTTLSGGNQQKVVIGKWLAKPLKLLLLAEPSRGVDVKAKAQVHDILRRIASDGTAVLFASTELDEVLALADRVVVMFQGRIVGDLPWHEATEHKVTSMMSGVTE